MDFDLFWFCFILSVLVKMRNLIFEISITQQALNINNQRTKGIKSINLDISKRIIEYSLENILVKGQLSSSVLRYCCLKVEGRSLVAPVQRITWSKIVKCCSLRNVKKQNLLEKTIQNNMESNFLDTEVDNFIRLS